MPCEVQMKYKQIQANNFKFDDSAYRIEGYASVFGGVDSYGDTVIKGAYLKTLEDRKRPIRMRWNHFGEIIGKWTDIREDEKGLYVVGELTKGHTVAENVYASLKHGAIDGMSIGYFTKQYEANDHGGADLHEVELIEISVVEEPADLNATISAVKNFKTLKEYERALRDVGFSQSQAKQFVSGIKNHRDGDVIDCSGLSLNL